LPISLRRDGGMLAACVIRLGVQSSTNICSHGLGTGLNGDVPVLRVGRAVVSGAAYPCPVRYLQRGAATAFGLIAATLIVFWAVKDTKPSSGAVLPILYAVLGVSAVTWAVTEGLNLRADRRSRRSGNDEMNSLIRRQFRSLKRQRRLRRILGQSAPEEPPPPPPETPPERPQGNRKQQTAAVEHEPIRWDQIDERPQPGEEPIALEPWLEDRIAAYEALVRQRPARGDRWFFAALGQWDVRNTHELLTKVAPDQVDGYYRGDGVPGYRPGQEEAYYERQLKWLVDKLHALGGCTAASSAGAEASLASS
jgi:hypothetical protein